MRESSRRTFIVSAGAVLAACTSRPPTASDNIAAGDKINVAVIGLGIRGAYHLKLWGEIPGARLVAVCDVNQRVLERGLAQVQRQTGAQPKAYQDMRQIFDDKEVHAVVVAVPNHWHALATIWACQAGKDVYVEKPACHNPWEGWKMVEAARKYNRIVQVGSQGRSLPLAQKAIDLLHRGVIGKVYLAKGLCYKWRPSIGHHADEPVPAGLDWDKFLGPAPMRPYNDLRYRYNWNFFWDTGNGDIGNQGPHQLDIARWGLGKGLPQSVVSTGGKYVFDDDQETPNTQIATFDYGDSEIVFEVRGLSTGGEGGIGSDDYIRDLGGDVRKVLRRFGFVPGGNVIGNLFYGSEGWMALTVPGFQVYKGQTAEKIMDETAHLKDDTLPHVENFLAAVRSRDYKSLNADIEVGVTSTNLAHLANASYRLKRLLQYDEAARSFVNDAEANACLTRKYRAPYIVPDQV
ncbi:MAG: Gfo/Idh/MocA family protein [Terriglobia bacterium]